MKNSNNSINKTSYLVPRTSNLLVVTPIFPPDIGGPASYTSELQQRMTKLGWKVKVITFSKNINSNIQIPNSNQIINSKSNISNEDVIRISINQSFIQRQISLLIRIVEQLSKSDVVYIQGTLTVGLTAVLAAKLFGKRIMVKFVGDEVWEGSVHSTKYEVRSTEEGEHSRGGVAPAAHLGSDFRLEGFYESEHPITEKIKIWLHRLVLKMADTVVVPSQYLKDFLVKYHSIDAQKIEVIPNAVELPMNFTPDVNLDTSGVAVTRNPQPASRNFNLVFVGRLVPWKNVDQIIEAVMIARKNYPWTLTIVGDGPEHARLEREYEVLCTKYEASNDNLEPRTSNHVPIFFAGQLSKEETLKLVARSSALLLYSSYEGHPHTILEAHALGIPTIASDIPPHQDLGCFTLAPLHNPEALAKAINLLPQTDSIPTPPLPPTWHDHIKNLIDVIRITLKNNKSS